MSQPNPAHCRSALLFAGHMVDLPSRARPQFPPYMEAAASREIAAAIDWHLQRFGADEVIAISSLARGGDILFQEHGSTRRVTSYVILPFEPHEFITTSVSGPATGDWEARFWQLWNRTPSQQREVVESSAAKNPYEACNQRQIEIAQQVSKEITLIALFDAAAGAASGTGDLIRRVRAAGGEIKEIDTRTLLPGSRQP